MILPGIARKKPTKKEEKEERGAWLASMAPLISINTKTWSSDAGTGAEC